ncbi:hypothetical protein CSUB01_02696 [Colletotrichum sublineola]|uniref:Uncharacterized protein n=1 Tax=Colletotrichum sublineola TaxID=1173701 RepID=A0A066X1H0_COLSU|nr:hypothetical protein CSUB01_02696 [Colletotrichum sublineola]
MPPSRIPPAALVNPLFDLKPKSSKRDAPGIGAAQLSAVKGKIFAGKTQPGGGKGLESGSRYQGRIEEDPEQHCQAGRTLISMETPNSLFRMMIFSLSPAAGVIVFQFGP